MLACQNHNAKMQMYELPHSKSLLNILVYIVNILAFTNAISSADILP